MALASLGSADSTDFPPSAQEGAAPAGGRRKDAPKEHVASARAMRSPTPTSCSPYRTEVSIARPRGRLRRELKRIRALQPRIRTAPLSLTGKAQELLVGGAIAWVRLSPVSPSRIDLPGRNDGLLGERRAGLQESESDTRGNKGAGTRHTELVFTAEGSRWCSSREGFWTESKGVERADEKRGTVEMVSEASKSEGSASAAVEAVASPHVAPMPPTVTLRGGGTRAHEKSQDESAREEPRETQWHLLVLSLNTPPARPPLQRKRTPNFEPYRSPLSARCAGETPIDHGRLGEAHAQSPQDLVWWVKPRWSCGGSQQQAHPTKGAGTELLGEREKFRSASRGSAVLASANRDEGEDPDADER